jgi:hypothetical protein
MTDALKPCPFCGGKAQYENDVGHNDEGFWEWYECTICAAKADSAETWNRRVDLPVRVKPLVWNNFDTSTYWAESTSGTYRVQERHGNWRCTLNLPQAEHLIYEYTSDGSPDCVAPFSAAQADHDARIRAALEE